MQQTSAPRVPRRWNVEVDGIKWLPRLCDKARMSRAGTLGTYLVGHSPVDYALLTRLGITTDEFVEIANTLPDDTSVLSALRARGFDEARVRRWSDRFETSYRVFIPAWDIDEGYVKPNAFVRTLLPLAHAIEGPAMLLLRKVRSRP
jgi:hypothetical protein